MSSPAPPTSDSSDLQGSDKSLRHFIRDLGTALQDLNSAVISMTEYMVDGVINDDFRAVLEEAAARRSGLLVRTQTDPEAFVVIDGSANPSSDAAPGSASGDNEGNGALPPAAPGPRVHVPPERRWYAIPVGRDPGIFQGAHHVTPNIERIPGGHAIRCDDEAHARTIFDQQLIEHKVKRVTFIVHEEPISFEDWHAAHP
ncbi:hypothetical protein CVT26_004588 [Gymnopilus dilepis]|uniref:Uncharacterized protein n=1 Tax=Gymnopilus dilepis TaxID=231916 RepID=A0A409WC59_9AGAR|nr:hypothetical protein CVT26_004588 [Gymnopilus dilepis]